MSASSSRSTCACCIVLLLAAATPAAKLAGTDFVEIPAEKSGLTDGIDKTVKYPWMSPPVDVNGDGHPDLMYYGHHGGGSGFWFGRGDGTFTFDTSGFTARWVWSERDPTWWDVNGDGFMDGIRTPHKDARVLVNDGTGHWKQTNIRLRGMIAGMIGIPKMLRKRRSIQQRRRVSLAYLESILSPVADT